MRRRAENGRREQERQRQEQVETYAVQHHGGKLPLVLRYGGRFLDDDEEIAHASMSVQTLFSSGLRTSSLILSVMTLMSARMAFSSASKWSGFLVADDEDWSSSGDA